MIITNVDVITCNDKNEILKGATVVIEGKKISRIIPKGKNIKIVEGEVLDGTGKVMLPGFIDTHTHSAMTFLRNYGNDMNLQDWLFKKVFPAEDKLDEEATYSFYRLATLEYIRSGITTHCDNYFFMNAAVKAVDESGLRAVLARSVSGCSDKNYKKLEESVLFMQDNNGAADGRITTTLSPHSIYTSNKEYLRTVFTAARELDAGIQMHISETKKEVLDCMNQRGVSPVVYIDRLGGFDTNGIKIAAHCVHISDNDIEIMKRKNVSVAANVCSNLKLASGVPNLVHMQARGLNVSLGTDGASSNNNLSMLNEMRFASLVSKGVTFDPTVMSAMDVIRMATVNGAKAIGRDDLGSVEEGKTADLVLIDLSSASIAPVNDIAAAVVYSAQSADVDTVFVDGKLLMKDKKVLTGNEEEIKSTAKHATERILA